MNARAEPGVWAPPDRIDNHACTVRPAEHLALRSVSKSWDGGRNQILASIDLSIEPGALVSLVGANGAGKTTLLRIVAGLILADSGTVTLDGLDAASDRCAYQRRIGLLSAGQTGLYARFSVRNHLDYWARIAFVPRSERREAVERTLRRFALDSISGQRADRLSMGQRQRVRLAMTFLHQPQLVLLDEPRNSLDPAGIETLRDVLSSFVANGGMGIWCAPTAADVELPVARAFTLAEGQLESS